MEPDTFSQRTDCILRLIHCVECEHQTGMKHGGVALLRRLVRKHWHTVLTGKTEVSSAPTHHQLQKEFIMRFHEGNFAYDIEQLRDPQTQLFSVWRFTVFKLRPVETVITKG